LTLDTYWAISERSFQAKDCTELTLNYQVLHAVKLQEMLTSMHILLRTAVVTIQQSIEHFWHIPFYPQNNQKCADIFYRKERGQYVITAYFSALLRCQYFQLAY